jgi:NAD(P)-dependent dehydrogenase (short-subunit alcohol dehydrogenase family)
VGRSVGALSLSPRTVLTPGTEELFSDPQLRSSFEADMSVGRIALPDDMARAALFLISDDAWYTSGTDVGVDGGVTAASV